MTAITGRMTCRTCNQLVCRPPCPNAIPPLKERVMPPNHPPEDVRRDEGGWISGPARSGRAGYLNLPQPQISGTPQVIPFARNDGSVIAVIELGGITMHIINVEGARALAAAFTEAAELIREYQ